MNVDELLDLMEETLEEGPVIPLSGGRHMVDVDRIHDIVDDVRNNLPDEIRQSKGIVNDRKEILEKARRESEEILRLAREKAAAIVSEQEIVKAAQQRAAEIEANAKKQGIEMVTQIVNYCDQTLKSTEDAMLRGAEETKKRRLSLRQGRKK